MKYLFVLFLSHLSQHDGREDLREYVQVLPVESKDECEAIVATLRDQDKKQRQIIVRLDLPVPGYQCIPLKITAQEGGGDSK